MFYIQNIGNQNEPLYFLKIHILFAVSLKIPIKCSKIYKIKLFKTKKILTSFKF